MRAYRETRRKKIAVVAEDDDRVGSLVEELLKEIGFETHRAADGVTAINEILERKPDVLILDLVLPRLRGQEICAMVRKSPTVNRTAIVVISGNVEADSKADLFRLGADDFVSKPFQTDELTARVQAVYHRAQHRAHTITE